MVGWSQVPGPRSVSKVFQGKLFFLLWEKTFQKIKKGLKPTWDREPGTHPSKTFIISSTR